LIIVVTFTIRENEIEQVRLRASFRLSQYLGELIGRNAFPQRVLRRDKARRVSARAKRTALHIRLWNGFVMAGPLWLRGIRRCQLRAWYLH